MDNMTSDFSDVVSYITTWEEKNWKHGIFSGNITKVNAKTMWRNNIWKDELRYTAIMCCMTYRYIEFILIRT